MNSSLHGNRNRHPLHRPLIEKIAVSSMIERAVTAPADPIR